MLAEGSTPDFIVVDGGEGGTGAAPPGYSDHVGQPLTEGLVTLHNALVGVGLRDRIRVGASGKVATGSDIVKRLIQGADYTLAARAMMMATGCIQAQRCHTNTCPVGWPPKDPRRTRALDVADKTARVYRCQRATVADAQRIMASVVRPAVRLAGAWGAGGRAAAGLVCRLEGRGSGRLPLVVNLQLTIPCRQPTVDA
jgi:glutamate synthase domain-containing protein 2